MKASKSSSRKQPTERSVLELTAEQARSFFLKPESYCRLELPPYFDFGRVLKPIARLLSKKPLPSTKLNSRQHEDVNYTIYSNKDGRFAWRPFQLIHPAIYVDLVHQMTGPQTWNVILLRFAEFELNSNIKCLSIPQQSLTKRKDQGAQVRHWWHGIEQASIELALDFNYVLHTDITDCYGSAYTHSIAWAVHGKAKAKEKRKDMSLIGNMIDNRTQDMRNGQTNGIPQGSVLFDLIAELVLGYADLDLSQRLANDSVTDFRILRYRDDYRIFVNEIHDGELILKALSEILTALGLKLNVSKTTDAQAIVDTALKNDKRDWMRGKQWDRNLQKHLLLIHCHAASFPNAGSLITGLDAFYGRLDPSRPIPNPMQLVSIAVDIGCNSPRCFPACAAIVSKVLSTLASDEERLAALARIRKRLQRVPNSGHLEVWLQRISYIIDPDLSYGERLCKLLCGKAVELWNNSWISDAALRAIIDSRSIIDMKRLIALDAVVPRHEFGLFTTY